MQLMQITPSGMNTEAIVSLLIAGALFAIWG